MCMRQQSTPSLATRPAISGEKRNAETSLTIVAPAPMASRATSSLVVSIETRPPAAARPSTTGSTRSSSSASGTGSAPGRVDSPPTSRIAAPSSRSRSPCSTAACGSRKRPPSENESGVTLTTPMTVNASTAEVCPSGVRRLRTRQVHDEPGRAGNARLLRDRLEDSQVHERRIALDHAGGVGEVAQRRGLSAGALERGAALGTGADDLGERAAHLSGEDHVADLDRVHLDAERFASARDLLEQPFPDLELALEHVVDAGLGHRRPEGQLRDDIQLVLVALGLVERPRRI